MPREQVTFQPTTGPQTYQIADVMCHLELAVGACTLGVNYSLWYPLAVEMSEQVKQVKVLQQEWTVLANSRKKLVS